MPVMGRLLLVEDESLVSDAIKRSLRGGYLVSVLTSVSDALRALHADERWDAVIADIGLPDGDGLDVLEATRSLQPGVPMLAITGGIGRERVNRAFELGAYLLVKPVRRHLLLRFLEPCALNPLASLLMCVQRHPRRWQDGILAFVTAKLEAGEWLDVTPAEWPGLLDDLASELRAALPADIPRTRWHATVH